MNECMSAHHVAQLQTGQDRVATVRVGRRPRTSDSQVSGRRHGVHLRLHGAHVFPRVPELDISHHQVACQPLSTEGGGKTENSVTALYVKQDFHFLSQR